MDAPARTKEFAKRLRRKMSLPEVLLWRQLRQGDLAQFHFRKQHPLGPYVLDFYSHKLKLAIEIDGYSHGVDNRHLHDAERDEWVAGQGVRTLRIPAVNILKDLNEVVWQILAESR